MTDVALQRRPISFDDMKCTTFATTYLELLELSTGAPAYFAGVGKLRQTKL